MLVFFVGVCEKQHKLWFDIFRVVWYNKKPRAYLKR